MVRHEPAASLGRRIEALALTVVLLVGTLIVGWLVWSVFEWRNGRTPSYRLMGLHVVRRSDEQPIGLLRSFLRSGVCCPLMVVPTIVIGGIVAICFAMGASPPDGLLKQPRAAPWDLATATKVLDARAQPAVGSAAGEQPIDPIGMEAVEPPRTNGHDPS